MDLVFLSDCREFHLGWLAACARAAAWLERTSCEARAHRARGRGHLRALRQEERQIRQLSARARLSLSLKP